MARHLLALILLVFSTAAATDEQLKLLLSSADISKKINRTAADIDRAYKGEELVVIGVMRGSIFITADLVRTLRLPVRLETINSKLVERSDGKTKAWVTGLETLKLKGKNVMVVDDIFDSGKTITTILNQIKKQKPKTLRSLVLFSKQVQRKNPYQPEYILFKMEEVLAKFPEKAGKQRYVVGYGLDYEENYRGLSGIYAYTP